MIVKIGNIFESKCTTIANTINCVGVMGKGIALEFKNRYPQMYSDYVSRCKKELVKPGVPYIYKDEKITILNIPTKDHWRSPSRLSYVIDSLDWFIKNYEKYNIKSVAFPPLGCGNGGLSWSLVGPIMYDKLHELPIDIEIYAPFGTSQNELTEQFLSKKTNNDDVLGSNALKVNPKWYLILYVVRELNNKKYSLNVGRTIYQKICYVLTRNGVDTGFVFSKGNYGPFSVDVKNSITALANANLIIEKKLGNMISICVSEDVKIDIDKFSKKEYEAVTKTIDLFNRVKNSDQAEMIATVLYSYDQLIKEKQEILDSDIYEYVLKWKPSWKEEKDYELCDSITNLAMLSLIQIKHSGKLRDTILI